MKFEIDKQTINDLELFEKTKEQKSIISLFYFTKSSGGKECLKNMFHNPFTDINSIENRVSGIRFFQANDFDIYIDKECLGFIEHYLKQRDAPVKFSVFNSIINKLFYQNQPNEQFIIQRGIRFLIFFLNKIYFFMKDLEGDDYPEFILNCRKSIIGKVENTSLLNALNYKNRIRLFHHEYCKLDYFFRNTEINTIKELLDIIYEIDALKSVAIAAGKHGFKFPVFTEKSNHFAVRGIIHPLLENPVSNDFSFTDHKSICFLTGPNMAGKSTFLKSLGISVYLAHLGFPVPAKHMETSIFNGLLTTINLSDNINKGYSHFYNEVLRVKYVAERINEAGNIFTVFDELFRGTNVKDAYDASLAVISAFSRLNKGVFAISTHIVEIAEKLNSNKSIFFNYFEANMVDEKPQYTYILNNGVTNERIGMYILKKENVLETIEKGIH